MESCYRELTKDKDLELIFTIRHRRKVNRDNTVRFKGKVYQLLPLNGIKSLSGKWVEVCEHEDGRISIQDKGSLKGNDSDQQQRVEIRTGDPLTIIHGGSMDGKM